MTGPKGGGFVAYMVNIEIKGIKNPAGAGLERH